MEKKINNKILAINKIDPIIYDENYKFYDRDGSYSCY